MRPVLMSLVSRCWNSVKVWKSISVMWVWAAVCQLQEDHNLKLTASEILALSRENEETELRCVGQLAWFETAWLKRASFGSGGACWCMQADSAKAHKVKDRYLQTLCANIWLKPRLWDISAAKLINLSPLQSYYFRSIMTTKRLMKLI